MKRSDWGRWQTKCITEELTEEIAGYVRDGLTFRLACAKAGVPKSIGEKWLAAGAEQIMEAYDGKRAYVTELGEFSQRIVEAHGDRAHDLASSIKRADEGGSEWRALAWLLERTEREDYAQKIEVEHGPQTIIIRSSFPGIGPPDAIELEEADVRELPTEQIVALPEGRS